MTLVFFCNDTATTENAYSWYRKVSRNGLGHRVCLYKGASSRTAPLIKESKVPSSANKGEVPLLVCNPDLLKDAVVNAARRPECGGSRLHFPQWLGGWFWDEWQAEVKQADGRWRKVRSRNEALDLACMNRAAALKLGTARINWDNPPAWARTLEHNSERVTAEERRRMKADKPQRKPLEAFQKTETFRKR